MDTTKLTSIRLESKTIEKIDNFVKTRTYWKRSGVINNILAAVLENFTPWEIYQMVQRYNWERNKVNAKFEITEELKPLKPRS